MEQVVTNGIIDLPLTCNACGTNLIYDKDGSLSENGFECWYCPECFWYTDDWYRYPRPKNATV